MDMMGQINTQQKWLFSGVEAAVESERRHEKAFLAVGASLF